MVLNFSAYNTDEIIDFLQEQVNANFPGFYNSMSKKPTITAFFEV